MTDKTREERIEASVRRVIPTVLEAMKLYPRGPDEVTSAAHIFTSFIRQEFSRIVKEEGQ